MLNFSKAVEGGWGGCYVMTGFKVIIANQCASIIIC